MDILFQVMRASLWGTLPPVEMITENVFQELQNHALVALPAPILSTLQMSDELRKSWETAIYQQISYQAKSRYAQRNLRLDVPYVILKGTSATQYYPHPECRILGDIDVMTRHEDYETACKELLQSGYTENTSKAEEDFGRHRGFYKNSIEVEVHSFFALRNDPVQAEYLDKLIIENINPSHVLPDLINGLVLLAHIDQHMESGLGLRHIIDWMMFVDKCLPDEKWREFRPMAQNIGLEKLAVITTRLCEIYLGLSIHNWCKNADPELCKKLMDYVMASGNFGTKRLEDGPGTNLLTYARTPESVFRLLQERGLVNWKAAKRYMFLRPFAWIYQVVRYFRSGFGREEAIGKLKAEFGEANDRVELFDALGVKQTSKGLAVYKDGRYIKTYKRP